MYIIGSFFLGVISVFSIISFLNQRRYLLMCLLRLEGILLVLIFLYIVLSSNVELFILFVLLSFAACEASLGLACLVIIVRSYGGDRFKVFRGVKC